MALNDFFAGEIATELLKMLISISRKSLLCRTSAEQLKSYIDDILPTIQEIKYTGVELPEHRQFQLDRFSEILRSGVELSHKVLSSSRWNVYKNLQLAKKMEKLEKNVSRFMQGPMQVHTLADVHHTRFEMAEGFDRVDRKLEKYFGAMKIGVGGGGWVEEAVRSCMEEDENCVEGSSGNLNLISIGLDLGKKKVMEKIVGREHGRFFHTARVGICPGSSDSFLRRPREGIKLGFRFYLLYVCSIYLCLFLCVNEEKQMKVVRLDSMDF